MQQSCFCGQTRAVISLLFNPKGFFTTAIGHSRLPPEVHKFLQVPPYSTHDRFSVGWSFNTSLPSFSQETIRIRSIPHASCKAFRPLNIENNMPPVSSPFLMVGYFSLFQIIYQALSDPASCYNYAVNELHQKGKHRECITNNIF